MRKFIAMLITLIVIAAWIWLVGTVGSRITDWPAWFQPIFYIAAGILWVIPLYPVMRWMNAPERHQDS